MMNLNPVNDGPLNSNPVPITVTQDDIAFDGYGLQNANVVTFLASFDDSKWIELNQFQYPQDDGSSVISRYYRWRDVTLSMTVKWSSKEDLESRIDDLKRNLRTVDGNLDYRVGWETRRIRATLVSLEFDRKHYNLTFVNAKATFRTSDAFWYAKDPQSFEFLGQTGTFSGEFTNGGSSDSDPKAYLVFWSGSAVTSVSFQAFGRTLAISWSFVQNDILIVDSDSKTVTKNGSEIDYTGQFPVMRPWSCPFTVSFVGTTSCDVTVTVPKNYL